MQRFVCDCRTVQRNRVDKEEDTISGRIYKDEATAADRVFKRGESEKDRRYCQVKSNQTDFPPLDSIMNAKKSIS